MKKSDLSRITFLFITTLILQGCGTPPPVPLNYAPSSVKSAEGSVSVADFSYVPATPSGKKPVAPNQIRNTAMGDIKIDRDVSKFVRDAVFSEFRFVGIKINDPNRILTGEIEEFLIDDLGYSIDWTLQIKYVLTDPRSQKPIYIGSKTTKRNTAKFVNVFGALNETVKINVEQLLDDTEFSNSIK